MKTKGTSTMRVAVAGLALLAVLSGATTAASASNGRPMDAGKHKIVIVVGPVTKTPWPH